MFLETSGWTYNTGGSGAVGIGFVAASGGMIYLDDPTGTTHDFTFGGLGAALSVGFRIPKMPKVQLRGKSIAGTGATTDFPSAGVVMKSSNLGRRDLKREDIQGAVVFVEGGGGLIAGGAGTAMMFGMNPLLLAGAISNPALSAFLMPRAIESATGAVLFAGVNAGVQAGGGIAGMIGYMG